MHGVLCLSAQVEKIKRFEGCGWIGKEALSNEFFLTMLSDRSCLSSLISHRGRDIRAK